MAYSRKRINEVAEIKRATVRRIRTDIGLIDTSRSHKYIEDFTTEFATFQDICIPSEILDRASEANLVWIGDYHALSRSQQFSSDFVHDLFRRNPNIALGVEPVFARHQKVLEKWMDGEISEPTFLNSIRYEDEWGCDWRSYRLLFDTARDLHVPIFGVDCHPRYDMRSIGRRDRRTARRIASIIQNDPSRTLVVVFGESHLASRHLPGRVRNLLSERGTPLRDLVILQNLDEIYWKLQKRGLEDVRSVRLKDDHYCVFNATPIEKYESFRQYLYSCLEEDVTGAWTRFVHTLIDITMEFVDLKFGDVIVDSLPKVYSEIPPSQLPQFLARLSIPATRARQTMSHLEESGTSYVPELNSIFIHRLQLASAAEESTRFIHQLCRGDLPVAADRPAGDQFFVTVIERALGYFCSKLLDSSRDGIETLSKRVLGQIGYNEQLAKAVSSLLQIEKKPAAQHFETLKLAISTVTRPNRTTMWLGQLLGYALGNKLYGAYLETRISRKDLQALFLDPMDGPDRALECYRELTERLS
jgi:hypothetical protein